MTVKNKFSADWTKITSDPLNPYVRNRIVKYLNGIRMPLINNDYDIYITNKVKNKSVLDIGVCEHTMDRIESNKWKHNILKKAASKIVGIDIVKPLVSFLVNKGFDVRLCDATSNKDLNERFDVIHIGDVIEHVESPVSLIKFAKRHLKKNGVIILRTPNPYCFNYVHSVKKNGTDISNLEHMFYICPIHMMEIARRSGTILHSYKTLYPNYFSLKGVILMAKYLLIGKWRHALAEFTSTPETYSTIFVYELKSL
jgi:2-polyprenyl-3-methyl-5-hydroxy-6-metoxy-1,4-benzoquinol methylase